MHKRTGHFGEASAGGCFASEREARQARPSGSDTGESKRRGMNSETKPVPRRINISKQIRRNDGSVRELSQTVVLARDDRTRFTTGPATAMDGGLLRNTFRTLERLERPLDTMFSSEIVMQRGVIRKRKKGVEK